MEDLAPEVIAALARAAKGNPELRSAASAIFAALKRRDEREQEAWRIVGYVANLAPRVRTAGGISALVCPLCEFIIDPDQLHPAHCEVAKARALLAE